MSFQIDYGILQGRNTILHFSHGIIRLHDWEESQNSFIDEDQEDQDYDAISDSNFVIFRDSLHSLDLQNEDELQATSKVNHFMIL